MRSTLVFSVVLLLVGHAFVRADDAEQYNEIRQLLSSGKLEEAEKAFTLAIEAAPDSARLKTLYSHFYFYLNRAGRTQDAARYAEANVEMWLDNLARSPQMAPNIWRQVDSVTTAYVRLGQHELAVQKLDEIVDKVEALLAAKESAEVTALLVELRARKALLLASAGRTDAGRELLQSIQERAEAAVAMNGSDTSAILTLATVLSIRAQLEAGGEAGEAASKEHLNYLATQAQTHPASQAIVSAYLAAKTLALSHLVRSDAALAGTELATLREFLASLDKENQQIQNLIKTSERGLSSLESRIAAAKAQQALIGQSSFPLEAEAWVNGDDLTDKELEGKVVLIDFWAVWCGPCIATFPHLREWQDKYSDKGLVIIGATRYYSYDWDDATNRIKKVENLSTEDERAAMSRFAQYHELKHRFMVMPKDSRFSKKYGVTGIPQAVLIGRDGKVQMIRVGSGEANAHDLEAKIEELLAVSN
ncbi:MAG: TlpA family protein disulfide reductase [Planctomycetaceae bacterium]|nr:TlpA family protein disulfide reductase [Planctomycetales bacterium]MCB9938669.1 TlpA family protein disulfide reductase [Planctomycetaceae bacterium]